MVILSRRRVELLFDLAALLEQELGGRSGSEPRASLAFESTRSASTASKSSPPSRLIPAVAMTSWQRAGHAQERDVERASADVVDHDVIFLDGQRVAIAVGVLEAGGRGLVEQAEHLEARAPKRIEADEALRAVRVGGSGDEGLERAFAEQRGAMLERLRRASRERARRNRRAVDHAERVPPTWMVASGEGSLSRRLNERTTVHSGSGDALGVEAETELAPLFGDDRGKPLDGVARRRREADDR